MVETMREYNGAGLAAPQVHTLQQICVIEVNGNPRYPDAPSIPLTVLINPVVTPLTAEMDDGWEGCLSVPDMRGVVPRYTAVRLEAYGRDGERIDTVAKEFFARVIQHETDHLHGIVYVDRMRDLSTLTHLAEWNKHWLGRLTRSRMTRAAVTAEELVEELDARNQAALERLAPDATLAPEVSGSLTVPNLLKVALKNEIEATEIAARWLVTTDDVEVKMAFARQAGDEAKHYRMIAERLRELGVDVDGFNPLAKGYGPLFTYLDTLTSTVERVAAGQFTREAIAVVKNRQFIEFCDRAGDRVTATLYRDVIEPDERFHHQLGRTLLLRSATTAEAQELARRAAARTLALAEELQTAALKTAGIHHAPGC